MLIKELSGLRWLDIESAPRDGTRILGFGEAAGEINGPTGEKVVEVMSYCGMGDYTGYEWSIAGDAYSNWFKPTHWMPLPAHPPAITVQEWPKL